MAGICALGATQSKVARVYNYKVIWEEDKKDFRYNLIHLKKV